MKHLYHWHMGVEMRGGRDVWRLTGEVLLQWNKLLMAL